MTKTGKHVIIIVNFILISAFISRFYFDKVLSDYNESISVKNAILQQNANFEKEYNQLKIKLATIKTLSSNSSRTLEFLSEIISYIPDGVKLNDINCQGNDLAFDATISSSETLKILINNLSGLKSVDNINITNISRQNGNNQTSIVSFLLNMKTSNN